MVLIVLDESSDKYLKEGGLDLSNRGITICKNGKKYYY